MHVFIYASFCISFVSVNLHVLWFLDVVLMSKVHCLKFRVHISHENQDFLKIYVDSSFNLRESYDEKELVVLAHPLYRTGLDAEFVAEKLKVYFVFA